MHEAAWGAQWEIQVAVIEAREAGTVILSRPRKQASIGCFRFETLF